MINVLPKITVGVNLNTMSVLKDEADMGKATLRVNESTHITDWKVSVWHYARLMQLYYRPVNYRRHN